MSKRNPRLLLQDITDSARKIEEYTKGFTYDDFLEDSKTIDAVVRNFEIIGEAANRMPEDFKERNPQIDWHRIRGFRNRIVHDYMGIDFSIIWTIKETYLPELIKQLQSIDETIG